MNDATDQINMDHIEIKKETYTKHGEQGQWGFTVTRGMAGQMRCLTWCHGIQWVGFTGN